MSTSKCKKHAKSPLATGSSGKKSVIQELHTSRGTSHFEDAVISAMFGISLALGSISRSQEVLLDRIESIAVKVETLQKEVTSLQQLNQRPIEILSPTPLELPSEEEMMAWLSSPMNMQVPSTIPDLTCSETIYSYADHNNVQI